MPAPTVDRGGWRPLDRETSIASTGMVNPIKPRTQIPLVDLQAQIEGIQCELWSAIQQVVARADFVGGAAIGAFEEGFASYCETPHAVGVGSGTDALVLALRALGVGPADEVITVAHTFTATAEAIVAVGARPVFVDIEPRGMMMDPERLAEAVTSRTRAVIPVHLYGQIGAMAGVWEVAERHGLAVLEDAAQAHGAEWQGERAGAIGHAAAFSFYPGKNLGAFGDAGAVTTRDAAVADRIRMLRDHGRQEKYEHVIHGVNSRLDTLQAAVLSVKLAHLDDWTEQRRTLALQYAEALASVEPVTLPEELPERRHVYHLFVIRVPDRDALLAHLKRNGVGAGVHYPIPLHLQPAYADLGYDPGALPETERAAAQVLSLPLYPEITPEAVAHVCTSIEEFFAR